MVRSVTTANVEICDQLEEWASEVRIGEAGGHKYIRKECEGEPHQGIHSWKGWGGRSRKETEDEEVMLYDHTQNSGTPQTCVDHIWFSCSICPKIVG